MSTIIRIPKRFYDDHVDVGDLDAPPVEKVTKLHYWVDLDHEHAEALLDDAAYYVDEWGPDLAPPGVTMGARGLLKAVARQAPEHPLAKKYG